MTKKEAVIEEFKKHCVITKDQTNSEKYNECCKLWEKDDEAFVKLFGPKNKDKSNEAFIQNTITRAGICWFFIGAGLVES